MSPTSTNRSPRHRSTDVGDSDFVVQEAVLCFGWGRFLFVLDAWLL
ncbi:MAG: hypothetical protein K2H04_02405 [Bacteroidaceae bacterium]|nr:hypothetical protein [Bacteroidaceae bacterium]